MLVIAEVRTRASDAYGGAAASVDVWKQRKQSALRSSFFSTEATSLGCA